MATLDGFILLTATCVFGTVQRGRTLALPWQQWLGERATILHYTYISLVLHHHHHHHVHEGLGMFPVPWSSK
jgi:hypothetical protein